MISTGLLAICIIGAPYCDSGSTTQSLRVEADSNLVEYFNRRGFATSRLGDGTIAIENGLDIRDVFISYYRNARLRADVAEANLFTAALPQITGHIPQGVGGRQILVENDSGIFELVVLPRSGSEKYLRYMPEHPDANRRGYIEFPEIDFVVEMRNLYRAVEDMQLSIEALRHLDPNLVLPDGSRYQGMEIIGSLLSQLGCPSAGIANASHGSPAIPWVRQPGATGSVPAKEP